MVPHGPESLRLSWSVLRVLCCGNPELEQAVYLISSHTCLKFYAHPPKKRGWSHLSLTFYFWNQVLFCFYLFCRNSGSIRHPSCMIYTLTSHFAYFTTCTCFSASCWWIYITSHNTHLYLLLLFIYFNLPALKIAICGTTMLQHGFIIMLIMLF